MSKTKGPFRFAPLMQKLNEMDNTIENMKTKIENMKQNLQQTCAPVDDAQEEEVCPDEIESEIAILEIMKGIYVEALAEEEPEGDA